MKASAVLGSRFPLDHLVASGMFTNWALLSFEFCTYLSHQSEKYKSSESVWKHGILMEMKEEIKSLKTMRRKMYSTVGTILKKKKRIVKQCVVENTQRDGRKAFDKMEKLKCLAENPLLYQFKRWLLVV